MIDHLPAVFFVVVFRHHRIDRLLIVLHVVLFSADVSCCSVLYLRATVLDVVAVGGGGGRAQQQPAGVPSPALFKVDACMINVAGNFPPVGVVCASAMRRRAALYLRP